MGRSKINIEDKLVNIQPKYYFVVSGLLAAFLAFIAFSFLQMLGNGKNIILVGDAMGQYAPIISSVRNSILNYETIWYSFEPMYGTNLAYQLMFTCWSPFNILYLLLWFLDVETVTQIVIIFKIACMAMAFTAFARKVTGVIGPESIFFSLCYAFGGYTVCYGISNFMFLDSVILLPCVLTATVCAFKNNRFFPVIISYALLFITDFHLGYSIGIFTLLFVVIYMTVFMHDDPFKSKAKSFMLWAGSVCTAILISAVFLLPGILQFVSSGYEDATEYANRGVWVFDILNTMFWGTYDNISLDYGMMYSGIPVLILGTLFFFDKNIKAKHKIFWGLTIGVFLICMAFTPIYYALCAFDIPDGFNYRFGFAITFSLCAVAMLESEKMKDISIRRVVICMCSICTYYLLMLFVQGLCKEETSNSVFKFIINLVIILVWFLTLLIFKKCKIKSLSEISLAILLIFVELISFAYNVLPNYAKSRFFYEGYVDTISEDVKILKQDDNSFYRIITVGDDNSDTALFMDYNGVSNFATCRNERVAHAMNGLGFADSPRNLQSSGYTPVTEMLFDIKYLIKEDFDFMGLVGTQKDSVVVNSNVLNLGYMVDDGIKEYVTEERNVFNNSNKLLNALTGNETKVYIETNDYEIINNGIVYEEKNGKTEIRKETSKDGTLIIELQANLKYPQAYMQFETDISADYEEDYYFVYGGDNIYAAGKQLYSSQANEMYYNSLDDKYMITLSAGEKAYDRYVINGINVVYFSKEALDEYYADLSKEQLIVEEWEDGYIKGHIDVTSDRCLLFLSIPYENGWNITVNGQKVEPIAVVDEAFTAIELPGTGSYDIEMKFKCPGVVTGAIITSTGLLITALIFVVEKRRKQKDSKETDIE